MAIDILAYKKQVEGGKAKIVRLSNTLAVMVLHQYDANTGERLNDAMEQIEIDVLTKARDETHARASVLDELIASIQAQKIVGMDK